MTMDTYESNPHAKYMPSDPDAPAPSAAPAPEPQPAPQQSPEQPPQQPQQPPKWLDTTAKVLSAIFSPLMVPTYACAVALWITPLVLTSEKTRLLICLAIFLITTTLPLASIILMMRAGKIKDSAISDRKERTVPFLISLACYLAAAWFMHAKHAPAWLWLFYAGAASLIVVAMLINIRWKISAHSMTMGGLTALFFFIALHDLSIVVIMPWLIGVILLSGAVGTSRLVLKRHTPAQVYAGFLIGLAVELFFLNL